MCSPKAVAVPCALVGSTMSVVQEAAQSVLKRCNVYLSQPDGVCAPMSSKVSDDLLLVATFIPLAELSPEDLAAERAALEGAGFSFPQADDTFDIQPGGPYIAAWNPLHTVLLTGPAGAVGRNPTAVLKNVMAVINTAVEAQKNNKLFQDLFSKDKTLSDNVSSSQVVFTPSSNAAGSTKVQVYVCLPSDHSLRAFLAALTLPPSAASLQDLEGCPRAYVRRWVMGRSRGLPAGG